MTGTTLGSRSAAVNKMGINLCSNGGGNPTQINTIGKVSPSPDKCYRRKNKAGRGWGHGRVWRWDVAILKMVRKGFCEKVTLEPKWHKSPS